MRNNQKIAIFGATGVADSTVPPSPKKLIWTGNDLYTQSGYEQGTSQIPGFLSWVEKGAWAAGRSTDDTLWPVVRTSLNYTIAGDDVTKSVTLLGDTDKAAPQLRLTPPAGKEKTYFRPGFVASLHAGIHFDDVVPDPDSPKIHAAYELIQLRWQDDVKWAWVEVNHFDNNEMSLVLGVDVDGAIAVSPNMNITMPSDPFKFLTFNLTVARDSARLWVLSHEGTQIASVDVVMPGVLMYPGTPHMDMFVPPAGGFKPMKIFVPEFSLLEA